MKNNANLQKYTIFSDLGGVVLEKGFWKLWDFIEQEYSIKKEEAMNIFLQYYKDFFSGNIDYETFWASFEKELGLSKGADFWHQKLLEFFTPQKDVLEIYNEMRNKGFKLVLLSDQVKNLWEDIDKRYNISAYFDEIIISSDVGFSKPGQKIYKYALEKIGTRAQESIFIDDREENLDPAKQMGFKVILYKNPKQLYQDLLKITKS